jgi:lysophospholipase L1-like esterase
MMTSGWERVGSVLLVVASIGLTFAAFEVAIRLTAPSGGPRTVLEPTATLPALVFADLVKPNRRGVWEGALFETNSAGFRGAEIAQPKPPDVFRIVVVGDSFTMGSGVGNSETYAVKLEEALNSKRDRRYEVLNLGISGNSLRHSVSRLRRVGLALEPDLVLYGFTLNDLEGPGYVEFTRPAEVEPGLLKRLAAASQLRVMLALAIGFETFRDRVAPRANSYRAELDHNFFENRAAWAGFRQQLTALRQLGRSVDACVGVLIHTSLHQLDPWHPLLRHYDAVALAAEELELFVVRSWPQFRGKNPWALRVHPGDSHPNATGHALLAEAVVAGLELQSERCGGPRIERGTTGE